MTIAVAKRRGIHYTPPELARFLAQSLAKRVARGTGCLRVLDPACGDGVLLAAIAEALPKKLAERATLVGFETEPSALEAAEKNLLRLPLGHVELIEGDFLAARHSAAHPLAEEATGSTAGGFDAVIANPPYVRTQVLGAQRAGRLAQQFGLSGRVDLYYAFARAMADVLRPGGALGLLVSNRFLTIRSGAALRAMLESQFSLEAIYDLGDTKLFSAAVLPAIVIATKQTPKASARCRFDRVYVQPREPVASSPAGVSRAAIPAVASVLAALADTRTAGLVRAPTGLVHVERGFLSPGAPDRIWTLASTASQRWLGTVRRHAGLTFGDVGRVRVGIKTTADEVFIRDDWESLPESRRPEPELLRPLLRHFSAVRWLAGPERQTVLYPHAEAAGRRQAVALAEFPCAARYLESHRGRLSRRKYVADSGRQWYEIWVPHHPGDWAQTKIVFPDIAADSRFFLDRSGAVVNGDCYWITLRRGRSADWLLWMLAVANSSLITRYYDVAVHNKLYAGRRRFMTQYVKQFPLPELESRQAQAALPLVRQLIGRESAGLSTAAKSLGATSLARESHGANTAGKDAVEREIDALVWQAFGLAAPAVD